MPALCCLGLFRRLTGMVLVATLALSGCVGLDSFPDQEAPMKIKGPSEGYLLEPGNLVRLTVFGESNLSGDFTLDPSGTLALPLVGNIRAAGLTAPVVAGRIEEMLRKNGYLQEPKVAVEVLTFRPFYVLGEVRSPGEFPYLSGMTVLSAIARAGGYDYRARQGEAVLVRDVNGEQVQYHALERTPILPGDIIKVMERMF
ncbi:MAG: polysaccharide export protein [Azospirillaceae bacterium]|nr:polysaccharide export protein [Azospirillaceae bacterium]